MFAVEESWVHEYAVVEALRRPYFVLTEFEFKANMLLAIADALYSQWYVHGCCMG